MTFQTDDNGIQTFVGTPAGEGAKVIDGNFGKLSDLITSLQLLVTEANAVLATLESTTLAKANNLSELTATASTARTNLGLGTASTHAATDFDTAGAAATAQANAEAASLPLAGGTLVGDLIVPHIYSDATTGWNTYLGPSNCFHALYYNGTNSLYFDNAGSGDWNFRTSNGFYTPLTLTAGGDVLINGGHLALPNINGYSDCYIDAFAGGSANIGMWFRTQNGSGQSNALHLDYLGNAAFSGAITLGGNLNADSYDINLDGSSSLTADGSGNVTLTGAFLSLDTPVITLQGTGALYVNTSQEILMNGGKIVFANASPGFDVTSVSGKMTITGANIGSIPSNTSTPVAWEIVNINSQDYFRPLYQ